MWLDNTTTSPVSSETSRQLAELDCKQGTPSRSPSSKSSKSSSEMSSGSKSPTSRRLTLVWQTTKEGRLTTTQELLDRLRSLASWRWVDPSTNVGPPEGWKLAFQMEVSTDGYVVLTLWPEATD